MFIPSTTQLLLVTRPPDIRPTYDEAVFRRALTPQPLPALALVVSPGPEPNARREIACGRPQRVSSAD